MSDGVVKTCRGCGVEKSLGQFHKDAASSDEHRPRCKECIKAYDDTLRKQRNARARERYAADPTAKIVKTRQYHLDHPEWSRERLRAHHEANASARAEAARIRGRDPQIAAARRDASRRSEQRRRAWKRGQEAEYLTTEDLLDLLEEYEHRCWICGRCFGDQLPVAWDHVQPLSRGGKHIRSNLRPSCGPCNTRKNAIWPFTEEDRERIRKAVLVAALAVEGVMQE